MNWQHRLRRLARADRPGRRRVPFRPAFDTLEERCLLSANFVQTNLVSDVPGMAETMDPHLINPWGITEGAGTPFWVADNNAGVSTLYDGQGTPQPPAPNGPLVVTIPASTAGATGSPTGVVSNPLANAFEVTQNGKSTPSFFLFATLDGNIEAWSPGANRTQAFIERNTPGAEYTGLAIDTATGQAPMLYAANFAGGTVDAFGADFKPVTLGAGAFTDPNVPKDFHPFNVQELNGLLYVTFVQETTDSPPVDNAHAGNGFVDVFDRNGTLVKSLIDTRNGNNQHLNSPWGLALAPQGFGDFGGDLLVGNFGDGVIHAFDPNNGNFLGTLNTASGKPFQVDNLWGLKFGNGTPAGGNANTLYFTAGVTDDPTKGPFGASDGLFGSLQAIPSISESAAIVPNLPQAAEQMVTTVPANGDVNPYGVAFVPQGFESGKGSLRPGDILVSNFNNSQNVQGTGSTVVRITPDGQQSLFFQAPAGSGLTTALGVLREGIVVVGNVPTTDGTAATIQNGSLIFLDSQGKTVLTLQDKKLLQGPWDLAVNDQGDHVQLFVSDVLSGTVTRIDLHVENGKVMIERMTQIASGYKHEANAAAVVVGPTGLAYDAARDVLYVASTDDNEVFAVAHAGSTTKDNGTGQVVYQDAAHLHGPLGLVLAPNGDLITANGDAVFADPNQSSELVEFIPGDRAVGHPLGQFVGQFQVDTPPGAAFGLAATEAGGLLRVAAVNDNTNQLDIFTFRERETPRPPHDHDDGHHGDQGPSLAQIEAQLIDAFFRAVEAALMQARHHHAMHHQHHM